MGAAVAPEPPHIAESDIAKAKPAVRQDGAKFMLNLPSLGQY
jgi:hypothetical protein